MLHFTTHLGLLGIMAAGQVLSRDRLGEDEYLEHIYTPNCATRTKDAAWTDYVNMSVSRVNLRMLTSSRGWHDSTEVWWAVVAFDISILDHPGVVFTSTNNTYQQTVRRGSGVEGFEAMFALEVPFGYYGSIDRRHRSTPTHFTTNEQAEILYPIGVPLQHLSAIYVPEGENLDDVRSWQSTFTHVPAVPTTVNPKVFT